MQVAISSRMANIDRLNLIQRGLTLTYLKKSIRNDYFFMLIKRISFYRLSDFFLMSEKLS